MPLISATPGVRRQGSSGGGVISPKARQGSSGSISNPANDTGRSLPREIQGGEVPSAVSAYSSLSSSSPSSQGQTRTYFGGSRERCDDSGQLLTRGGLADDVRSAMMSWQVARTSAVWTMSQVDVGDWLVDKGLGMHRNAFEQQQIDGRAIIELWRLLDTDPTLFHRLIRQEMGVQSLGHTLTLATELRALVLESSTRTASVPVALDASRLQIQASSDSEMEIVDQDGEIRTMTPPSANPDGGSTTTLWLKQRLKGLLGVGGGEEEQQDKDSKSVPTRRDAAQSRKRDLALREKGYTRPSESSLVGERRYNRGKMRGASASRGPQEGDASDGKGLRLGPAGADMGGEGVGRLGSKAGAGGRGQLLAVTKSANLAERASEPEIAGMLEVQTTYLPFMRGPYTYTGLNTSATFGRTAGWKPMERWALLRKRAEAYETARVASQRISSEYSPTSGAPAPRAQPSSVSSAASNSSGSRASSVKGLGSDPLGEPVCFLEVNSTDTHAVIWRDRERKRIVVGFRGTDINWKDVLVSCIFTHMRARNLAVAFSRTTLTEKRCGAVP